MKTRLLNKKEKLIVQKAMDELWDGDKYGYISYTCVALVCSCSDVDYLFMAYSNFCGNQKQCSWFDDCEYGPERQLARWMCLWFFMKAGEVEV